MQDLNLSIWRLRIRSTFPAHSYIHYLRYVYVMYTYNLQAKVSLVRQDTQGCLDDTSRASQGFRRIELERDSAI